MSKMLRVLAVEDPIETKATVSPAEGKPLVLVVEDNRDMNRFITENLAGEPTRNSKRSPIPSRTVCVLRCER